MLNGKRVLALNPTRSGSVGIPNKNIKLLAGKPLMVYTIEAALQSKYVDVVMESTDSSEYAEIARAAGASTPFLRPAELSTSTSKTIDSVMHALNWCETTGEHFDILVLLQATSPFRTAEDIDAALEQFESCGERGLVSISESEVSPILIRTLDRCEVNRLIDCSSTIRRQDMPKYYRVNGAIYINRIDELTNDTSLNDNPIGYKMDRSHSVDIDEPLDWVYAEALMAKVLSE